MDNRKVEQILKEIFSRYGVEIVYGRDRRFEAAISDLLDEREYPEERAVLRRASESTALWPLLNTKSITDEKAEIAVACLERESRMTREDAVFVVQCVVSARGGNPNIVKKQKPDNSNCMGAKGSPCLAEDNKGSKVSNQEMRNQNTSVWLLEAPCSVATNKQIRGKIRGRKQYKGKLYLYSNRLEFVPNRKGERMQLDYQDIHKIGYPYRYYFGIFLGFSLLSVEMIFIMGVIGLVFTLVSGLVATGVFALVLARTVMYIKSYAENELAYKIYYCFTFRGAHKKRAMDIIQKGMKG